MKRPRSHLVAACMLSAFLLSGCYITEEGSAFLSLIARAKPAAALLKDPATPQEERDLLERVARIRTFAIGELGLKDTKNYTTLVHLDSDRVATVVQACAELSFHRYLWAYPVVGKLPYKGFFDPKDAAREKDRLKKEGYDVIVRPVDAFSTLGWFSDPLYSFMASYSEADIAELVIHEMTHATAFSKSTGDFNEELATFVGREGAKLYLASRLGKDSPELAAYEGESAEAGAFAAFLRGTAEELEALYSSSASDGDKRAGKARIIAERAALYKARYAPSFATKGYRDFSMEKINNAYLDLYRLYEGESELYADYEKAICDGDLRRFIAEASRIAKLKGEPKDAMKRELASGGEVK
jgi:predicted aminopeptidase